MRILVADKFPAEAMEDLRAAGHAVDFKPDLTPESLSDALGGIEVLIVRSTAVTGPTISAADTLRLIVRAGAGTNTIDVPAANAASVAVANTPGKNAVAVAELAMGLLLAIDRNIPDNVADLRAGRWNKKRYSQARGLKGRKLGIVGFGDIGSEMAERAGAFGMSIFSVDRPGRSERAHEIIGRLGVTLVSNLEELFSRVEVISLHVPSSPITTGMMSRELLEYVQPGTVIINTSRGDVIDERALLDVIEARDLRVGTDVYLNEPSAAVGEFHSEFANHPRVYGTHHIGASTDQAQQAVADEVVAIIEAFQSGEVRNRVES